MRGRREQALKQRPEAVCIDPALTAFFANVDFQEDILLQLPFRGFLLDREGEVLAVHALDQRRTADDLLHLVCLKMADKVARLPEVGARIRLLDELLYVVLAEDVDRKLCARPDLLDGTCLAGCTEENLLRLPSCTDRRLGHRAADLRDRLLHSLYLFLFYHACPPSNAV